MLPIRKPQVGDDGAGPFMLSPRHPLSPMHVRDRRPPSLTTRLIACVQYGAVSTSITLFNRAVFSVYHFNFPNFVTLVQILVSIAFIYGLRAVGAIKLGAVSVAGAQKVAPLTLFWWLYVVSGVTALRYLNVPMFSVTRRSTTLLVVLGEFYVFQKQPSRGAALALTAMVGGAVVAGLTDLTFSGPGYAWVSLCVVTTAVYLLLIKKLKDSTGMNQHTLLLYNNLLALPLMLAFLVLGTDEVAGVAAYPRLWDPSFQLFLLVSCSQAFLLNMCIFRCTLVNSPLTTNVTGQAKDILTTALGMVLFRDVRYHAVNIAGILLGLAGSIAYSVVSYRQSRRE